RSKYNRIRVVVIFIIGEGVILIFAILNWWQLLSEFSGVVMGVLLAFWINNQHEKKLDRKRSVEFLKLIHDELTENNDTLRKTIAEFQTQVGYHLPYYRLRLFAWNALSNRIS